MNNGPPVLGIVPAVIFATALSAATFGCGGSGEGAPLSAAAQRQPAMGADVSGATAVPLAEEALSAGPTAARVSAVERTPAQLKTRSGWVLDDVCFADSDTPLLAVSMWSLSETSNARNPYGLAYRLPLYERDGNGHWREVQDRATEIPGSIQRDYVDLSLARRRGSDVLVYDLITEVGAQTGVAVIGPDPAPPFMPPPLGRPASTFGRIEWSSPGYDPDLCVRDGTVWVAGAGQEVWVSSFPWGAWRDWSDYTPIAPGCRPSIVDMDAEGLAVAFTDAREQISDQQSRPHAGPILLTRSPDGLTWSEPAATVPDALAQTAALAWVEEAGLILVYTAESEDGWPVFAARSADCGTTWGRPVRLSPPEIRCIRPDAAVYDGVLHVVYLQAPKEDAGGSYALGDPTGVYTLTLDPATLPVAE